MCTVQCWCSQWNTLTVVLFLWHIEPLIELLSFMSVPAARPRCLICTYWAYWVDPCASECLLKNPTAFVRAWFGCSTVCFWCCCIQAALLYKISCWLALYFEYFFRKYPWLDCFTCFSNSLSRQGKKSSRSQYVPALDLHKRCEVGAAACIAGILCRSNFRPISLSSFSTEFLDANYLRPQPLWF